MRDAVDAMERNHRRFFGLINEDTNTAAPARADGFPQSIGGGPADTMTMEERIKQVRRKHRRKQHTKNGVDAPRMLVVLRMGVERAVERLRVIPENGDGRAVLSAVIEDLDKLTERM